MNTQHSRRSLGRFLLGDLTVSIAAELEDDGASSPHGAPAQQAVVLAGR